MLRRIFFLLIFLIIFKLLTLLVSSYNQILIPKLDDISTNKKPKLLKQLWNKSELMTSGYWNYRNLSDTDIGKLSVLGRRLFLHEDIGKPMEKNFTIHIYKFGKRIERRFIRHYTNKMFDPFEFCSVKNCLISYNNSDFHKADAVLFHLHLIDGPPTHLERKNFKQRWVWLSDESIFNTFMIAKDKNLRHYDNIFNWSMTYRMDSDVPVPYGRIIPLNHANMPLTLDIFSKKNRTVAIMGSSCGGRNGRWNYVRELEKYIAIDTYGKCGKLKCPGHFDVDCPLLNTYKFYLAFENSNCKDYITEKVWWNSLHKEIVPVIMGYHKDEYLKHLPPNSFIHVDNFQTPEHLAKYLIYLLQNKEAYNKYHQWRAKYNVLNEHGYFQTNVFHYCRLCEALNYNDASSKTYYSMESFWNLSRDCDRKVFSFP